MSGAFESLGLDRRTALFERGTLRQARPAGEQASLDRRRRSRASLPSALTNCSTWLWRPLLSPSGRHPLDAHRARLRDLGCVALGSLKHEQSIWTAGLVVARQRPPTAAGFAFYVLGDGMRRVQAIISPDLWDAHWQLLRDASVLIMQAAAVNGRSMTLRAKRLCALPGHPESVTLASD
jgi:error-prone DNA polymerase